MAPSDSRRALMSKEPLGDAIGSPEHDGGQVATNGSSTPRKGPGDTHDARRWRRRDQVKTSLADAPDGVAQRRQDGCSLRCPGPSRDHSSNQGCNARYDKNEVVSRAPTCVACMTAARCPRCVATERTRGQACQVDVAAVLPRTQMSDPRCDASVHTRDQACHVDNAAHRFGLTFRHELKCATPAVLPVCTCEIRPRQVDEAAHRFGSNVRHVR